MGSGGCGGIGGIGGSGGGGEGTGSGGRGGWGGLGSGVIDACRCSFIMEVLLMACSSTLLDTVGEFFTLSSMKM